MSQSSRIRELTVLIAAFLAWENRDIRMVHRPEKFAEIQAPAGRHYFAGMERVLTSSNGGLKGS